MTEILSGNKVLDGFDQFWSVYPRRVAKLAAMRMYKRALKLTTVETILWAAKQYAAERTGMDSRFTAHPATWLHAGRWEDYGSPNQTSAATSIVGKFYAGFCSREYEAWNDFLRRTTGKGVPPTRSGGWWFDSRWPPDYVEHEAA